MPVGADSDMRKDIADVLTVLLQDIGHRPVIRDAVLVSAMAQVFAHLATELGSRHTLSAYVHGVHHYELVTSRCSQARGSWQLLAGSRKLGGFRLIDNYK